MTLIHLFIFYFQTLSSVSKSFSINDGLCWLSGSPGLSILPCIQFQRVVRKLGEKGSGVSFVVERSPLSFHLRVPKHFPPSPTHIWTNILSLGNISRGQSFTETTFFFVSKINNT